MWVSDTNELKVEGDFGDATIEKIKYQGTHEYDASLLRAILVDNEYFDIMKNEITIDNELLNKFNLRANLTFAFSNDISDVLVINCLKSIHTADYDVVSTEYAFGNLLMDIVVKIHRRKRNRRQIFKVCSKRFKRISKQK